jgi:hypothetical protein
MKLGYIFFMRKLTKSRDQIIESALIGGAVGASLGAILTGESKRTATAMLVGAAIGATIQAKQEAEAYNLSRLVEVDGKIYRIAPNGDKKLIKTITRSKVNIPDTFSIA